MKYFALTLFFVVLIAGCQKRANFNHNIDYSTPFQMTTIDLDTSTGYSTFHEAELHVDSEKGQKLVDFLQANTEGWHSNVASVIGDIIVTQGDFKLIYSVNSESVFVAYLDTNGTPLQLAKRIERGQLDFLDD
ncbi:MAG: hypothetical protein HWE14_06980 [Flavobacteriia bacterium]|nr:hypothetical protein [Flavobacteriia bacterium]